VQNYQSPRWGQHRLVIGASAGLLSAVTHSYPLQGAYPSLLLLATFMELGGALLFLLNSTLGAQVLLLFTVAVTPVMHNFWDMPTNGPEQMVDMINCEWGGGHLWPCCGG
jgi:hypothetical protein